MKARVVNEYLNDYVDSFDNKFVFEEAEKLINSIPIVESNPVVKKEKILREDFVDKTDWVCVYCGEQAATVDHLIALDLGGTNNKENLAKCCYSCNNDKSNKTLGQFYEEIESLMAQAGFSNNEKMIGKYGFMLYNIQKQIDFADENYALMYSPKKAGRISHKTIHKRVGSTPANMSEIVLVPKKKSKPKAIKMEPVERVKYVTNIIPPAPKKQESIYLDRQIDECRAAGFDKLWKYEMTLPTDDYFRPIYKTHEKL